MKFDSKHPVSVEDLLRLKRAERPPAEFWNEFDRQLRAKQLAALVAKRPWWQRVPRVFAGFSRYPLPIGAAAILAITFVSVRNFDSAPKAAPVDGGVAGVTPAVAPTVVAQRQVVEPVLPAATPSTSAALPVAANVVVDAAPAPAAVALASEATEPGELSQILPLLGASAPEAENERSPAARYIAQNLAAVQASEPVLTRGLLSGRLGLDAHAFSARPTVEPLQHITPPTEARRSRLLTAMVALSSFDTSAHVTERVASQIPEERLYDRGRGRLGAQGDRLHVRF